MEILTVEILLSSKRPARLGIERGYLTKEICQRQVEDNFSTIIVIQYKPAVVSLYKTQGLDGITQGLHLSI